MDYTKITNKYGNKLDYEAAMQYAYGADPDICEQLNRDYWNLTPQQDFDMFCKLYFAKHGEVFYLNTENPCW